MPSSICAMIICPSLCARGGVRGHSNVLGGHKLHLRSQSWRGIGTKEAIT